MKKHILLLTLATLFMAYAHAQQAVSTQPGALHLTPVLHDVASGCLIDSTVVNLQSGALSIKWYYTHDTQGNLVESVWQNRVGNAWVNHQRTTMTYDAQGNMTQSLQQNWDNGSWVNAYRHTYTYNAQGNETERVGQVWESGSWGNDLRYVSTYSGQGNITQETRYSWNGSTWGNPDSQTIYTYNGQGNLTNWTRQDWGPTNTWVNHSRATHTYDAQGNRITTLNENFNSSELVNAWVNFSRKTFGYNAQNQLTQEMTEYWGNNNWSNTVNQLYTYTPDGDIDQMTVQTWSGGNWVTYQVYNYYYACITVGAEEISGSAEVLFYPNPVSDGVLRISGLPAGNNCITLHDMQGRLMVQLHADTDNVRMDVSRLPVGVYIATLSNRGAATESHARIVWNH